MGVIKSWEKTSPTKAFAHRREKKKQTEKASRAKCLFPERGETSSMKNTTYHKFIIEDRICFEYSFQDQTKREGTSIDSRFGN